MNQRAPSNAGGMTVILNNLNQNNTTVNETNYDPQMMISRSETFDYALSN